MFGSDLYDHHLDDVCEGDARCCPYHPRVRISSPDGLFDGLCGECEALCDEARIEAHYRDMAEPESRGETSAPVRMPTFDIDYVAPADEDIPF
jgi:hypothetical protein